MMNRQIIQSFTTSKFTELACPQEFRAVMHTVGEWQTRFYKIVKSQIVNKNMQQMQCSDDPKLTLEHVYPLMDFLQNRHTLLIKISFYNFTSKDIGKA